MKSSASEPGLSEDSEYDEGVFDNGNTSFSPPSCSLFYILANHSPSYLSFWPQHRADIWRQFACFEDGRVLTS